MREEKCEIIEKKKFLGNRELSAYTVASGTVCIEDWAFAHCKRLHTIYLPRTLSRVGRHVFDGCDSLRYVYVYTGDSDVGQCCGEREAELLAFAVTHFAEDAAYDFADVGTASWYARYDESLRSYIEEPDDKGFEPFLAGGEEDYEDEDSDIGFYCQKRRREKVRGLLLRLVAGECPSFLRYLAEHEAETLYVLTGMRERAIDYIRVYDKNGLLTEDVAKRWLPLFEGGAFTETRAYLLKVLQEAEEGAASEVWDSFSL